MWRRLCRQPPIGDGRAESKDRVGGLFLIEAGRHDEAPRLASVHPAALPRGFDGWVAELLPIDFYLGSRAAWADPRSRTRHPASTQANQVLPDLKRFLLAGLAESVRGPAKFQFSDRLPLARQRSESGQQDGGPVRFGDSPSARLAATGRCPGGRRCGSTASLPDPPGDRLRTPARYRELRSASSASKPPGVQPAMAWKSAIRCAWS